MSPDVIGYAASALVALVATVLGGRASRRVHVAEARVGEITANASAAKTAQETYSAIVADLSREVDRLRSELDEMRREVASTANENTALKRKVAGMQRTLDRMTRLLEAHNIPLPVD